MINLIKEYLKLNEKQLFSKVRRELENYYDNVKVGPHGTYIYAEGNIPIVLVAHLDVVFKTQRQYMEIFYDQEEKVMWSPDGLGTDDRAGVLMIVWLLRCTEFRPCILFTTSEETDMRGAYYASIMNIKPNFVIELDRQGRGESVYYQCDNKEFEAYINSFGFNTAPGTYTDICLLCPSWGCAGVNLSVGYYDEHSYSEHWRVDDFLDTYVKLCNIFLDNQEKYKFKFIRKEEKADGKRSKKGKRS